MPLQMTVVIAKPKDPPQPREMLTVQTDVGFPIGRVSSMHLEAMMLSPDGVTQSSINMSFNSNF